MARIVANSPKTDAVADVSESWAQPPKNYGRKRYFGVLSCN
jgi:hypothetical protein